MKAKRLELDIDRPIKIGLLYVFGGFFGFVLWAGLAPLTSAAVAPGVVVADSRNKTIQHLEGGILREVLVREGQRVQAGQILARLDSANADANLGRLQLAQRAALGEEARLLAERGELDHVIFPLELTKQGGNAEVEESIRIQQALFASHKSTQKSELGIIDQRIAQSEEEIKGIEAQIASEDAQIGLINEELTSVRELVLKGLERRPRLLALERSAAEVEGLRGRHTAEIARARQTIAELQERTVNIKSQYTDKVGADLRDVQAKLADLKKQILAAADASKRLDVKAPVSGKVISIFNETPGGVIKPGDTIMELLPDRDQLVIEAQVRPEDIEELVPQQSVRVHLTAYSQRRFPSLHGTLTELSADRITDKQGAKAHYLARVAVDRTELASHPELKLYAGMPAVAYIETGKESLLTYLLTPLFSGIERGLRER